MPIGTYPCLFLAYLFAAQGLDIQQPALFCAPAEYGAFKTAPSRLSSCEAYRDAELNKGTETKIRYRFNDWAVVGDNGIYIILAREYIINVSNTPISP